MKFVNEGKVNYTIIDKEGKVVEDLTFNDYEKLADHMMELADKWYGGIYTPDDTLSISTFDESGDLIYNDTATFGESMNEEPTFEEDITSILSSTTNERTSGEGFGNKT